MTVQNSTTTKTHQQS